MPSFELNASFSAASDLAGIGLGTRSDPFLGCNFLVEIENILCGGFSECSGLEAETEVESYREGGQNAYIHQFAGPTRYPPLILKHGLTWIDGLWAWHQDVLAGTIKRQNGTIYLLDRQRFPVMWWNFKEAFPVKWTGPALRADAAQVAVESVELRHRGLSRPMLAAFGGAVAKAALDLNFSASADINAELF
jgi:phage tail-like protein